MIIEINTNILKDLGITADDFVYLYLLHAKSHELISELTLKPNLEALQTKGLIKMGEEPQDHVVRQAFLDSFQDSFDRMWSELLSHFPLKVYNGGHLRVLRAKDAFAKNNEKALRKYYKVVGTDKAKHDHIVQCLKNELELRKSTGTLGYMQMLTTWMNNHTWEQYEDVNEQSAQSTGRITRKL
jgi:hypothetical protein